MTRDEVYRVGPAGSNPRLVHEALEQAAETRPDATLVTFVGDASYTCQDLWEESRRFAAGLVEVGIEPGDRVAILLPNCFAFLVAWFGTAQLGAVTAPLNTALKGEMLGRILSELEPKVVVVHQVLAENLIPALPASSGVARLVLVGGSGAATLLGAAVTMEDHCAVDPLPGHAVWRGPSSELLTILYTSGTTGPSKGVMQSHEMATTATEIAQWVTGYTADDVAYTTLPLFHANAMFLTLHGALLAGCSSVVSARFSASTFWPEAAEYGATVISLMGSMVPILWHRPSSEADHAHRIRLAVMAPTPSYIEEFERRFRLRGTEMYGLTDVGIPLGIPAGERRPGSCGRPTPPWECALVDEEDRPVGPGEVGELVLRPRRPGVCSLGYWRAPEATVAATANLWFHTGDRLRADDEGWYYFVDRVKDAMRRSGENVSAFEVEQALLTHPAVEEVAAFAVPSELAEDDVMVAVVLRSGAQASAAELRAHCEATLPYFAVPRFLDIRAGLPRTATQKVQKSILRSEGVTASTWDAGRTRSKPDPA